MKKEWENVEGGKQLEGFVGAWGFKTNTLETTENLIAMAARVFEVPVTATCPEMARAIEGLGPKERKRLAQKNLTVVHDRSKPGHPLRPSPILQGLATEIGIDARALRSALIELIKRG